MAKKLKRSDFPGIGRQNDKQTQSALAENIELLTGQRGSGESRALLVKDLVNLDQMKMAALRQSAKNGNTNDAGLPITVGGVERPHKPVNLLGVGGFTFIALTWDRPTYRGHAYAEIWRSETDSFSSAALIATEVTDTFSDSVNMNSEFYYWVRFVNVADMKGPTQGAAGVKVKTQESASSILDQIGSQIELSHLDDWLKSEFNKIPDIASKVDNIENARLPSLELDINELGIDVTNLSNSFDATLDELSVIRSQLDDIELTSIPNIQAELDDVKVSIPNLRADIDSVLETIPDIQNDISQFKVEIPSISDSIQSLIAETDIAKSSAQDAKDRVESIETE
ncbi:hypothetical protein KQ246_07040 [Pseudoalteromonas shioyasakiensis]|nr:hypothetical protein KQ246_07040 [Pseudoalteromonas shioyasakiensis]